MKLESIALHHGYKPEDNQKAAATPIYQSSGFTIDDTQHGADLFDLKVEGNIYSRIGNPTNAVLEDRVAAMEGGVAGLALASGMAAITYAIQCITRSGDNIISTNQLYGGTYNCFTHSFPKQGVTVKMVDGADYEVEHLESWYSAGSGLNGFVIGEVVTCETHPNADRLRVTTVNVGAESLLPIVCGAPNVAVGQKVVVALVGTEIEMVGKEPFVIGKAKIRGEVSEGMICAEDECGMGGGHDGILVLDSAAVVGMPASEYFGVVSDTVIEIGLTANRGDAASHLGVANDLAALLGVNFERIAQKEAEEHAVWKQKAAGISVSIEDAQWCERYVALEIQGVQLGDSPAFVKNRLRAIGIEPRNNVVDATNYFLHQTGQPSHAFDADKIVGGITVRLAKQGETLVLLDGKVL